MSPVEAGPGAGTPRILVAADTLFEDGADAPRPLEHTSAAFERLGWIGQPVVIIGERLAGHRLPADPEDRISWMRACLGAPDVAAAAFVVPDADRPNEATRRGAVEGWRQLGEAWHADRLITDRHSSVGPARRAGLTVVRIGPRDPCPAPSCEHADHEARDLLDAVRCLLTADAFGAPPGR